MEYLIARINSNDDLPELRELLTVFNVANGIDENDGRSVFVIENEQIGNPENKNMVAKIIYEIKSSKDSLGAPIWGRMQYYQNPAFNDQRKLSYIISPFKLMETKFSNYLDANSIVDSDIEFLY